jgi:dephospho-CoA kinase
LVAELYQAGQPGALAVAAIAGPTVLDPTGAVDHRQLGARLFTDAGLRKSVEAAVHPLVRQAFAARTADSRGIVVLEATLLVEAGFAPDFDLVVTVEADPPRRLERAIARGLTAQEAQHRLAAQSPEVVRVEAADVVIRNDGDLPELAQQVDALVEGLRAGLAPPGT